MRLISKSRNEQGDTIIEVIFAIMIFSFLAISSLAIMNQGIATGEKALEITLVRQQVNAQAEALRYIHEATVVSQDPNSTLSARWATLTTPIAQGGKGQAEASDYGVNGGKCEIPGTGYEPFILNARTAEIWSNKPSVEAMGNSSFPPYSQVKYDDDDPSVVEAAYGMWVESVPDRAGGKRKFVDFHIRACWPAPASSIPMTIGTIVRLYDPK